MKKFLIASLISFALLSAVSLCVLYVQRNSRPTIFCASLDGSIRPRNRCIMNPFRDKEVEKIAEGILEKLRSGQTDSLIPYLTDLNEDNKNHILEREKEYQVEDWRIGRRTETTDELSLMYWTSRKNYNGQEEETRFIFVRDNNEWKLKYFGAIY